MRKASLFRRARGRARLRGGRQRDHERRPGRERPSGGRRAARDAGVPRRHVGGMHRHADLGPRVPDRGALRPGRGQRRGHLRDLVHARREPHVLGHLARRSALPQVERRSRTMSPSSCSKTTSRQLEDITPARLPAARSLSNLPQDQQFTPVGYGAQSVTSGAGRQDVPLPGRPLPHGRDAEHRHPAWLKLSGNPRTATATPATATPAARTSSAPAPRRRTSSPATTITGDTPCRSTNVDYRLDTPSARAFLGQYVTLP